MNHAQKINRARQAGSRKKGKPKRSRRVEGEPEEVQEDPNATVLVPKSKEQKETERREKLRQEVCVLLPIEPTI